MAEGMVKGLAYAPAALAVVVSLVVAPVLAITLVPADDAEPVVVVAGPGADLLHIIDRSEGWVVGPVSAPFGALGYSDSPGFVDNLKANGAWAVLNGRVPAALCGVDQ